MTIVKRLATTATALGLAAASMAALGAGTAHAGTAHAVIAPAPAITLEPGDYLGDDLRTSHGVGIYSAPDASSTKYRTLWAPDEVNVGCWVSGGQVYNDGDVWYKIDAWSTQTQQDWNAIDGWVFAPYVDGADYFHQHLIPNCDS